MKVGVIAAVLATTCLTTLVGLCADGSEPQYTSTAWLRINPSEPSLLGLGQPDSSVDYERYKRTQRVLVKSRFVLLAALRKPEVAKLPTIQTVQRNGDPVRWLQSAITVEFPEDSEIMSVSVATDDPTEAATLCRAVTKAYLMEVVYGEQDQKRLRLSELDRAYLEKETEVRSKREDLKKLTEQLGISGRDTLKLKLALEQLTLSRRTLGEIQTELRVFKRDLAVQNTLLKDANVESRAAILKEVRRLEALITITTEQELVARTEADRRLKEVAMLSRPNVDVEMMQAEIKNIDAFLAGIAAEREKLRIEVRATPRVTLLQRADVPETPD